MRVPRQRIRIFLLLAIALCAAVAPRALAHETRPAYLEIKETSPEHYDILWRTPVNAGMRLPIVLQLPTDAKNLSAPTLQELTDLLVERRVIEIKGGLAGKRIEFVGLQGTITDVLVRVEMPDGRKSTTIIHPSQSWFEMVASQSRWAVAGAFIVQGVRHICLGADHLLFLLGLLLIVKNRWVLLKTVTAFTVAHSVTLAIATLGYAQRSGDSAQRRHRVEHPVPRAGDRACLARRNQLYDSSSVGRGVCVWSIARIRICRRAHQRGTAPSRASPCALTFNLGVEFGQLGFIVLVLLLERSFRVLEVRWPNWVQAVPGYTVGSLGAFWTIQRVAILLGVVR